MAYESSQQIAPATLTTKQANYTINILAVDNLQDFLSKRALQLTFSEQLEPHPRTWYGSRYSAFVQTIEDYKKKNALLPRCGCVSIMGSSGLIEKLQSRVIHEFIDMCILAEIKKSSLSGYDVISLIHNRFGILVSSGTVYSVLYSLERDGWIKGVWNHRKRVYQLAENGERNAKVIAGVNEEVKKFLRGISLLNITLNT